MPFLLNLLPQTSHTYGKSPALQEQTENIWLNKSILNDKLSDKVRTELSYGPVPLHLLTLPPAFHFQILTVRHPGTS